MSKVLGIIILILAILLFPPSVLALISNNAVPGDIAYPVKIKLEEGVVFLAAFNSNTKIWFSSTRSDRRFQEVNILLNRGATVSQTLNELVAQTDISATEISQITDQNQKQEFIANLQKSIQKYDDGLAAVQQRQSIETAPPAAPMPTALPTSTPVPMPIVTPKSTPLPTPVPSIKPQPIMPPVPTTPAPTVQPTSQTATAPTEVNSNEANNKEEIKKAREKLEEIKNKLKKAEEESTQNIPAVPSSSTQQPTGKDQSSDNHPSKK